MRLHRPKWLGSIIILQLRRIRMLPICGLQLAIPMERQHSKRLLQHATKIWAPDASS